MEAQIFAFFVGTKEAKKICKSHSFIDPSLFPKEGKIKLFGSKKEGYFLALNVSSIEDLESCVDKIMKIKNLKSVSFPSSKYDQLIYSVKYVDFRIRDDAKSLSSLEDDVDFLKWVWAALVQNPFIDTERMKKMYLQEAPQDDELHSAVLPLEKMSDGWRKFFFEEGMLEIFSRLDKEKGNIYPPVNDIFNAFIFTPLEKIKVVLIGQDPYHGKGQAMGLCFSVRDGIPLPPSLKNIFSELEDDGYKSSESGDLTKWAKRGVFMINTALTVVEGCPNSHAKLWEEFTESLLAFVNRTVEKFVVVAWGRPAKNVADACFKNRPVIFSTHPSPLGANTTTATARSFIGSRPFSAVNRELKKLGVKEIDWNLE